MDLQLWKKRKKELKLSFEELAQLTQISVRQLYYIFGGKAKNPGVESVARIERALGIKEEIPPSERTEGEKDWMQLYYALTDENRDLLVKLILAFKDMPPDRRRFVLDAIRITIAQK